MNAPQTRASLSRGKVMGLTLLVDVIGSILIVTVLPLSWSVRVILVAVLLSASTSAARLYLRRHDGTAA